MEELIFKYIEVEVNVSQPFKALTRSRDGAMILVRDGMGQWVLGKKEGVYPEGISKMLGGGIEAHEGPLEAARRELHEETGAQVEESKLVPLIHAEVLAHDSGGRKYGFSAFVFYCQISEALHPHDDVTGLAYLSDHDFGSMMDRYMDLPDRVIEQGEPGVWRDWGKVWGPVHQAAWERVKELGL